LSKNKKEREKQRMLSFKALEDRMQIITNRNKETRNVFVKGTVKEHNQSVEQSVSDIQNAKKKKTLEE
jgi:hypothetical protein